MGEDRKQNILALSAASIGVIVALLIGAADAELSAQTLCTYAPDKDGCMAALRPLTDASGSMDPKKVLRMAVKAAGDYVEQAIDIARDLSKAHGPAILATCQEMLGHCATELRQSLASVSNEEAELRSADITNWLSAARSYQETCRDSLARDPRVKRAMERKGGLRNATQLTSNALAAMANITGLLGFLHVPPSVAGSTSRNLVEDEVGREEAAEVEGGEKNDGDEDQQAAYPSWFSERDRRMLAAVQTNSLKANAVVAKDGSGNFKSITEALNAMPAGYSGKYVIYVKAGTYTETVTVTEKMTNVVMYGDGSAKTVVTGNKAVIKGVNQLTTDQTATFIVYGTGFIAKSMGFSNTAGPNKEQAVAVRSHSDQSAFFDCRIDGYQDTLWAHCHRQFYRDCSISGTVDFIFGDAAAVFQNCMLVVRLPRAGQQNVVTAQGRVDPHQTSGIVIQNCRIVPEKQLFPQRTTVLSYLGRPWKDFSRTVIMETEIGDLIQPEGWLSWKGNVPNTIFYAEYANRGPGAATGKRVQWQGLKITTDKSVVLPYTVDKFLQGNQWLPGTGIGYLPGLNH